VASLFRVEAKAGSSTFLRTTDKIPTGYSILQNPIAEKISVPLLGILYTAVCSRIDVLDTMKLKLALK
jgi:hypothetical protein